MFHNRQGGPDWGWDRDWGRWAREWGRRWEREWGGHRGDRRDRVFGRGDLKYVILDLLRDQPRHGYDIIRELESRFGGAYTPSAGAVYPTLQMLEDMGAVTSNQEEGRKVYTITEEGRRILEERRDTIDAIGERVRDWMRAGASPEFREVMGELAGLTMLVGRAGPHVWGDAAKLRRLRDLITRTRDDLRAIIDEAPSL